MRLFLGYRVKGALTVLGNAYKSICTDFTCCVSEVCNCVVCWSTLGYETDQLLCYPFKLNFHKCVSINILTCIQFSSCLVNNAKPEYIGGITNPCVMVQNILQVIL